MSKRTQRLIVSGIGAVSLFLLIRWGLFSSRPESVEVAAKVHPKPTNSENLFPFAQHFSEINQTLFLPWDRGIGFSVAEITQLCHEGQNLVITRFWALRTTELNASLFTDECFPVEMVADQSQRSMGACADVSLYIHHAHARLNPRFPPETLSLKVSLCPKSTYLHTDHLTKTFLHIPNVRNWWLPEMEQVSAEHAPYIPQMQQFLCKTKLACRLLSDYFRTTLHTSPVDIPLKYMSHSSPDLIGDLAARNMSFYVDWTRFFHSYGSSRRKNTDALVECWRRHPEWPRLTIVGDRPKESFGFKSDELVAPNLRIHERLPIQELRSLQMRNGVHVCPSQMEGYGHYVNEARSLGALVLTTDAAPMNEMIMDGINGVLIHYDNKNSTITKTYPPQFLSEVRLTADDVCRAVERVLAMDIETRWFLGREARAWYDSDTRLLEHNMGYIRDETMRSLWPDLVGDKAGNSRKLRLEEMDQRIIGRLFPSLKRWKMLDMLEYFLPQGA